MALDYGTDLSCTDDVALEGDEVSGVTCHAQALYRRVTTPRSKLCDDPNYGFSVSSLVDEVTTPRRKAIICTSIDREFLKDERTLSSDTSGDYVKDTASAVRFISRSIVTPRGGGPPFEMIMSLTPETVELISAISFPTR